MFSLLKETFDEFTSDECPRMAAAMAFYAVFSLPALLVVVISIAGLIAGRDQTVESLTAYFEDALGRDAARQIGTMLEQAGQRGRGIVASAIGFSVLLAGASGVMLELQTALNRAWGVTPDPKQSVIRTFLFKRLLSFGMLLGIVFLLLASLVISWMLTTFGALIERSVPAGLSSELLEAINLAVSLVVITLVFAALLKYVPDARIGWRDVWIGAAVTALLFTAGRYLISMYLGRTSTASAFGAAGSLVVVLLWVYYSAQIFLFGAAFTRAYACKHGSCREPRPAP